MKLTPKVIAYITLVIYWGPSNMLCYLWGFILCLFIFFLKPDWLRIDGRFSKKIVKYIFLFLGIFFASFLFNYFIDHPSFNNLFWSVFTYGSSLITLLALLIIPFKEEDIKKIFTFSIYLSLFQVFLGYFQMLDNQSFQSLNPFSGGKDVGDFFVGTTFNPGIGSLVAIKISLATLLFVPFWIEDKSIKNTIILFLLFTGWILASALFTLILGVIAVLLFFLIKKIMISVSTYKFSKSIFYTVILVGVGISVFIFTQRNNISYLFTSIENTYATIMDIPLSGKETTRKVIYYKKTLIDLPQEHPAMLFIGVGPGNYSSRSAWMVSGEYLKHQPDYIAVTPSNYAQKYCLSIWNKNMINDKFKGAGSIMHQPFSTWLSVFAEMGIPALIILFLIFVTFYKGFGMAIHTSDDLFFKKIALGLKISLVYIGMLFFMENLFEYPLVMGQFFVFACALLVVTEKRLKFNESSTLLH